ncbi:HTH-type transcriptional regulator YofA [Marinibacterium anthonyi]|nr:HTH-type transcriptional regulator YofA [Marinibacterium anthonyi]
MNLDLLRDFLCCAETSSLTRAADLRNTTQSNISKRLRALEDHLGQILIDRTARPIALTRAGQDFLPVARQILSDLDTFRGRSAPWAAAEGGLSIVMPHSASVSLFPRFKEWLSHRIPGVTFAPRIANHDMAAHMIAQSQVDLAIVTHHPDVPIDDRFTVFRAADIAEDRLVMVATPAGTDGEAIHVSHELTYIGRIWRALRDPSLAPHEVQHGMAADIRAYCLAGRGRGVLPASLVEADIAAGRLTLCPLGPDMAFRVSLYCAPRAHRHARRVWSLCDQDRPRL